jgi:capsular polysaccharide export protein
VGWGYKPNTQKTRLLAAEKSLDYWALEDGFISWLNHPSQAKPYERLSYIVDKTGIYYDASAPSDLDVYLESQADIDYQRIDRLRDQLLTLGVSKYNQARSAFPLWLNTLEANTHITPILLVDQTFDDASIKFSGGSENSFKHMLDWGINKLHEDPEYCLIIKIHPDVILGKKKGYLYELAKSYFIGPLKNRIHFLSDDVAPAKLISMCAEVATVSSQLGFEALWQDKKVSCFAWPFYSGRGLTQDLSESKLLYARKSCSLHELIYAALIKYPTYLHPDTQVVCEVEDILDYLDAHFTVRDLTCERLWVPNISLWKRSFIPEFVSVSAASITFSQRDSNANTKLIWGMKSSDEKTWRIEDGFIRSVGLGADLRRPSSLILDDVGIYYNGKAPSKLENLLNHCSLTEYELQRAKNIRQLLVSSAITKYNVEGASDVSNIRSVAGNKHIILVVGQFQKDLSMEFGALDIRDNLHLLQAVREDFPEAYIIYKEHPDVYSGVREGKLDEVEVLNNADLYLTDTSLIDLFLVVDRLCTICSLSGFEALMRGVAVSTYGLPFYAGWGLTDDRHTFERRKRVLTLDDLCFQALIKYPRYVNWRTRKITTAESTIKAIANESGSLKRLKTSWFSRQIRKLRYLVEAIFHIGPMAFKGGK